jgi:hypothetical protein
MQWTHNDQQELYYAMNMSMTSKNYNMQLNIDDKKYQLQQV